MKMFSTFLPFFIATLCAVSSVSGSCPSGWEQFEQYCYLAKNYNLNWQMSQQKCRQFNADLVKINSGEENEFVLQLVRRQISSVWAVWIGFYWHVSATRWAWIDNSSPVYTNWRQGEPNGNAHEPCTEMYIGVTGVPINGKWNDIPCNGARPLVCKKLA